MSRTGAILMKIRDRITALFGLVTAKEEVPEQDHYPIGSKINLFTVLIRNESEIVMGHDDKHLNFRTSILVDREEQKVYLTTIVQFHNWGDRLYFMPVKPVHKILIKSQFEKKMKLMNR